MTLREKQSIFALNVSKLISYAYEIGYEITIGEVFRTNEQQLLYYYGYVPTIGDNSLHLVKTTSKSKTLKSKHLDKLAIDINLFHRGKYLTDKEAHKPLAEYWKSLHEENVCGYDWGWDANHYQMGK